MAKEKLYNDLDPLLVSARQQSTKKTQAINSASGDKKVQLFKELVGSCGKDPLVNPNFRCEFGRNIHIGNNFHANYDCTMLGGAKIIIGDHVLFTPKVGLYTSNHLLNSRERILGGCIAKPISVGDNCWLGANVSVLPGVNIGNGVVIGAGSVVTHNIPDNVVAVGNPCKILHKITSADKTGFSGKDFI